MNNITPLRGRSEKDRLALARQLLDENPDGVLEAVAREAGVPTQAVLEMLPLEQHSFLPPDHFLPLWERLSTWGEVLFIVHTPDIVLECVGSLPKGSFERGYFNIHGDSPIGGHIKAESLRAIYFVDRPFHGRRSLSIQFFNEVGEAAFKVFVRRDANRALDHAQTVLFEALRLEMKL